MALVRRQQSVTVIELDAEYDALDQARLQQARELLLSEAQTAEPPKIVLDLTNTRYMGSAFIEVMVLAAQRVVERQGRLALCGLQPFCAEVLHAARLDTVFDTYTSVDEAVTALSTH